MSLTSNIVFFGTPPFAVQSAEAIAKSGRTISLVVTQPDRPSGRGLKMKSSAVYEWAQKHGIQTVRPTKLKDPNFVEELKRSQSRIFVVAAYRRILPKIILDLPELILNVHASLLPRWRGAAPIQRSILQGDTQTGISIMRLVEEMDAGDYMLQKSLQIGADENAGELESRLMEIGAQGLIESLDLLDQSRAQFTKQNPYEVTYAPPIKSVESKIDWGCLRNKIHNQVRAFSPTPGAHTFDGKGRMKIFKTRLNTTSEPLAARGTVFVDKRRLWVACADDWLEIVEVQREGRSRQTVDQFLSGYRVGSHLLWS